ncbi:DUF4214 domain-containing protein [Sphingomonas gei]|uniref:DUF4214 domain-containing protein n=1 Tax=Sphingomonas gei TaxID=1395960 RepID=A0A4S1WZB9_9SPHN|nr:DUF4214 domain-containing protein [Sphingomonas gei]TGX48693.1 DUF4214 domain-containing protein [Sphingomonas gei]
MSGAVAMVFAIVIADADYQAGFAGPVADDLADRPECRVATVASDLIALDSADMADILRSQVPDPSRTLVIGHATGARSAIALAEEIAADTALLVAPAWSDDGDISEVSRPSSSSVSISVVTGMQRTNDWLEDSKIDEQRLPLPNAALAVALRQSGAMPGILTAMIRGEPLPDLSGLVADWRRRNAHRIELAGPVQCSATGEVRVPGRIVNTGEAALVFGRAERDRLMIGARIRSETCAAWTNEARALPARPELEPGDSARFVIGLAGPTTDARDIEIELSLVSEGSFWYSDLAFPALRLGIARSSEHGDGPPASCRSDGAPNACDPDRVMPDPATLDDLSSCYRLILGRTPDADGFAYYARLVQAGMTVDKLVLAFVSAPEAIARFDALRQIQVHEDQTR